MWIIRSSDDIREPLSHDLVKVTAVEELVENEGGEVYYRSNITINTLNWFCVSWVSNYLNKEKKLKPKYYVENS